MVAPALYAASVVAMYAVFLTAYRKQNPDVKIPGPHRVAAFVVAIFWPLTFLVAAVVVMRQKPEIVGTDRGLAMKWVSENMETPVILHDVHGRHMMKAKHAAPKIAGGVCPTRFTAYVGGKWENLDTQEAPRW